MPQINLTPLAKTVIEMVTALGYQPFFWNAEVFNRHYDLVRVDPFRHSEGWIYDGSSWSRLKPIYSRI